MDIIEVLFWTFGVIGFIINIFSIAIIMTALKNFGPALKSALFFLTCSIFAFLVLSLNMGILITLNIPYPDPIWISNVAIASVAAVLFLIGARKLVNMMKDIAGNNDKDD